MNMRAGNTSITSTEHGQQTISNRRLALIVLSVAVALGASASPLRAAVSVHGNSASVHLEANNAPLSEVLSALESAFSIRHRTSVRLDQAISGTYRGPLRRVLSRVLDGFNYYVADTADGRIELILVGRSGAQTCLCFDLRRIFLPETAKACFPSRRQSHALLNSIAVRSGSALSWRKN